MALIKLIRNTLCVIIAMAALCSCNKTFSDSQFNKMYELNERGTIVFKGSINNKDYAAFINKYSPTNISGHSFLLDGNDNDTTAFYLKKDNNTLVFNQKGITSKYTIKKMSFSDDEVSGRLRHGLFEKIDFRFSRYYVPEYRECESKRYVETLFDVDTIKDVKYGEVEGYWTKTDYYADVNEILKPPTDNVDARGRVLCREQGRHTHQEMVLTLRIAWICLSINRLPYGIQACQEIDRACGICCHPRFSRRNALSR